MERTFVGNMELVYQAIEDVCELLSVGIEFIFVNENKAVIEFRDGTKHFFLYSYSRVTRQDIITHMVDYFLSVKRTDEDEQASTD